MIVGAVTARLRELLNGWDYERSPAVLVAMAAGALPVLLDSLEGKLDLSTRSGELEGRAFEDARHAALTALAAADLAAVLRAIEARGWSDVRVARSGIARVRDARVVPHLVRACTSKDPLDRASAVDGLACQDDERATRALIDALGDRSTNVRAAAIDALARGGDRSVIEPLRLAAKRNAGLPWLAKAAEAAVRKIQRRGGRGAVDAVRAYASAGEARGRTTR